MMEVGGTLSNCREQSASPMAYEFHEGKAVTQWAKSVLQRCKKLARNSEKKGSQE